jgi:NADH:ubiquinone oxidoreductase subunit H
MWHNEDDGAGAVWRGVAFLALLERRGLGYVHIRKSPSRIGFMGIVQPFSDAI